MASLYYRQTGDKLIPLLKFSVGIVKVARFNSFVVEALLEGAVDTLLRHGIKAQDIEVIRVPGAWELPVVAKRVAVAEEVLGERKARCEALDAKRASLEEALEAHVRKELHARDDVKHLENELDGAQTALADAVQQGAAAEIWAAMLEELKSLRAAVERLEEQQKLLAAPAPEPAKEAAQATPAPTPADDPAPHPFAAEMAALRSRY